MGGPTTHKTKPRPRLQEGSLLAAAETLSPLFTDLVAWSSFSLSISWLPAFAGCLADDLVRVALARLPVLFLAPHARG